MGAGYGSKEDVGDEGLAGAGDIEMRTASAKAVML